MHKCTEIDTVESEKLSLVLRRIKETPVEIHDLVNPVGIRKYRALECAIVSEYFRIFCKDIPLLAQIIIYKLPEEKIRSTTIDEILKMKRHCILKKFLGRGNRSDVKFLRKFQGEIAGRKELAEVLIAFRSPGFRKFCQGIRFGYWNYDMYSQYRRISHISNTMLKSSLFKNLMERTYVNLKFGNSYKRYKIDEYIRIVSAIFGIGSVFTKNDVLENLLVNVRSMKRLISIHDRFAGKYASIFKNMIEDETFLRVEFPEPPLREDKHIKTIRTNNELFKIQNEYDCDLGLMDELFRAEYYFYKYEHGLNKAIIVVKSGSNGSLYLEDISMMHNAKPPADVMQYIKDWLETDKT